MLFQNNVAADFAESLRMVNSLLYAIFPKKTLILCGASQNTHLIECF